MRAVIGDVKEPLGSDEYGVQLKSVQNYYPYGMPRPNNVWSATTLTQSDPYRFGFQGMQRDADVGNATTAPSTTPFRQYDARLALWWSVDPLSAMTGKTYQALGGNPISMIDPWGLEITNMSKRDGSKGGARQPTANDPMGEKLHTDPKTGYAMGTSSEGAQTGVAGSGSTAKAGGETQTSKQPETKKNNKPLVLRPSAGVDEYYRRPPETSDPTSVVYTYGFVQKGRVKLVRDHT